MEKQGKVCTKCGVWKPLEEYNKQKRGKYGRCSECKECANKRQKQYYENNKDKIKERDRQWRENNKEYKKERDRQWRENNKEYYKEYYENNKEHKKEYDKQRHQGNKQNNLQYISSMLEQINPIFKRLNLPVYGYVYVFENIKTGHKYVGQTIQPLKRRYGFEGGIVKGWIKERLDKSNQKFTEELIEEDIVVTEVLDVAFCQYHLDKLEAYYIDKYDSFLNGYNNNAGYWNRDDGIEEFNQILLENNLEFIDGKLVKIA